MPITNYGNLKVTIEKWLDRTDTATREMIPDFIYMAEKEIQKALLSALPEIPSLENEIEVHIYPFTDFVDMPADMGRIKYVYLPDKKMPLKVTTYPELLDMTDVLSGDTPLYYARHIRRLYFRPIPPTTKYVDEQTGFDRYGTTIVRVVYIRDPVVFSSDTDSSYFITTCPEVLLYGSLAYGFDFIKDYEAKMMAEQKMRAMLMDYIGQLRAEDIPDTKQISTPVERNGTCSSSMYPYM